MTMLYTEWLKSHPRTPDEAQLERASARQRQIQQATLLRTVVDHPGWQVLLDHLDALLADLERRRASLALELQNGPALGPDLDRLKLQLMRLAAEAHGLQQAKDLVPTVMRRGELLVQDANK